MTTPAIRTMPPELADAYTMHGAVQTRQFYYDNRSVTDQTTVFNREQVSICEAYARQRRLGYYGYTDAWLYQALGAQGLEAPVAVIGSRRPWYEGICLAFGAAQVTTVDYGRIVSEDSRIEPLTVEEGSARKFNTLISISSVEHDGLGRYGDPLDPDGDLRAMRDLRTMLHPGGKLYLAVPVGQDTLVWNAHRIYGRVRLPLLLQGWTVLQQFGFSTDLFDRSPGPHGRVFVQPVLVLTT